MQVSNGRKVFGLGGGGVYLMNIIINKQAHSLFIVINLKQYRD